MATTQKLVPRLKQKYLDEIRHKLKDEVNASNVMDVPRLTKIVLNMGMGGASQNSKLIDEAVDILTVVTGQKATPTRAKKAISNFKLREGMPIGAKVTLHGDRMWEFLDRLIHLSLPRVKDFRGISNKGFDGRGNYNLGIKEQIIFLEVNYDKVSKVMGMDISFVTTAKTDDECRKLLKAMGMPFRN